MEETNYSLTVYVGSTHTIVFNLTLGIEICQPSFHLLVRVGTVIFAHTASVNPGTLFATPQHGKVVLFGQLVGGLAQSLAAELHPPTVLPAEVCL